jgi:hypothetical protein
MPPMKAKIKSFQMGMRILIRIGVEIMHVKIWENSALSFIYALRLEAEF